MGHSGNDGGPWVVNCCNRRAFLWDVSVSPVRYFRRTYFSLVCASKSRWINSVTFVFDIL